MASPWRTSSETLCYTAPAHRQAWPSSWATVSPCDSRGSATFLMPAAPPVRSQPLTYSSRMLHRGLRSRMLMLCSALVCMHDHIFLSNACMLHSALVCMITSSSSTSDCLVVTSRRGGTQHAFHQPEGQSYRRSSQGANQVASAPCRRRACMGTRWPQHHAGGRHA